VHTSTKACVTSVAISDTPSSELVRDDKSGKQSLYPDGDLTRYQNLTICYHTETVDQQIIHHRSYGKLLWLWLWYGPMPTFPLGGGCGSEARWLPFVFIVHFWVIL